MINYSNNLEDINKIESELGIGLVDLYKCLDDGIWFIDDTMTDKKMVYRCKPTLYDINDKCLVPSVYRYQTGNYRFNFSDFNKTWGLDKNILLNEVNNNGKE